MTAHVATAQKSSQQEGQAPEALPGYHSILVAADASDHSNRAVKEAAVLGSLWQGSITGAHVYAAKLHDLRFRQMEGGLPEQYQEESELEKQRDIHDALITKGLSIITDSYLDQVEETCLEKGLTYKGCSLEGKNYTELVKETNSGTYDLLLMGSLGLGAVSNSRIGTVCERVARRSDIDTLVIKDPQRSICEGPIVVAVDGSTRSYGGLLTALALVQEQSKVNEQQIPLHVISAFDPYYHYVAFNRIAGVLSEEAGKVFRFKEQEKLHEDIIDAGLAKIYQGHLEVAEGIAEEYGVTITTKLLDGKPYEVIEKYLNELNPSLLIMGKIGIHADETLDIGGNAENLLRNVSCSVLLSQRQHQARVDLIAEVTTSWTNQAEQRMLHVPDFARGMARLGVLRYAQEQGHTVITEKIVDEATRNLCPVTMGDGGLANESDSGAGEGLATQEQFRPDWSAEAEDVAAVVADHGLRQNLKMRAEKKARQQGSAIVEAQHILPFMDGPPEQKKVAQEKAEQQKPGQESSAKKTCPFGFKKESDDNNLQLPWSDEALKRLQRVPAGFMRDLTRQRVETFAHQQGAKEISVELMSNKYDQWGEGSENQQMTMNWSVKALEKIDRIPDFVRVMVVKEVERCAQDQGLDEITAEMIGKASSTWEARGGFHSEGDPDQYKS